METMARQLFFNQIALHFLFTDWLLYSRTWSSNQKTDRQTFFHFCFDRAQHMYVCSIWLRSISMVGSLKILFALSRMPKWIAIKVKQKKVITTLKCPQRIVCCIHYNAHAKLLNLSLFSGHSVDISLSLLHTNETEQFSRACLSYWVDLIIALLLVYYVIPEI